MREPRRILHLDNRLWSMWIVSVDVLNGKIVGETRWEMSDTFSGPSLGFSHAINLFCAYYVAVRPQHQVPMLGSAECVSARLPHSNFNDVHSALLLTDQAYLDELQIERGFQ